MKETKWKATKKKTFFFPFNIKHMYYCQALSSSESATLYILGGGLGGDS